MISRERRLVSRPFPFVCPNCHQRGAIVVSVYDNRRSFLCPDCDHVWDDPPTDPRR
jgi:uncharacterized protein YlaI